MSVMEDIEKLASAFVILLSAIILQFLICFVLALRVHP